MNDINDSDTNAANKQRARDYFKAFASKDEAWLEANVAPIYTRQDNTLPFEVIVPEGVLQLGNVLSEASSEIELDMLEVIAENDKALVRLRIRGVHSDPFGDYPAWNSRFDAMVLDSFRMEDCSIAERWPAIDDLGLHQQIGMI